MSEYNDDDRGGKQDDDLAHAHDLIITMADEDGNEIDMTVIDTLNVDEQLYAILLQHDDPEADGIIVRLEEQGEKIEILPIEDGEEWERVQKAYNELTASQRE